ncbi:MAG TPA: hydrolase 2, exosortase A system-associated [Accumulibacter sp.]|uniref:hydrolase 2, exosortase A system-associated n=1 Tax=Accumulibacter sp. TaxID=2053492 RepID=UPI00287998AD|nr:hydrolase 2, exosortase A system-associated [Accumulibacter sp.]MDS4074684.1 hydrolase 2, exosortase A system-associated [Accumulibacter sp.]HMW19072.1 hydrolase 2, exosortase A system-associated [Accumulibacter sp.]HMX23098.1 hydrolase 2, exosortase A system-associated [Accumulibacter sp.]HNC21905.1 hydrolase 2, exosortase A system-associated [Accumulibacter sp.]HND81522.1 hydrolase 2, exosortase A system-associated [Accumulibacter sp.]
MAFDIFFIPADPGYRLVQLHKPDAPRSPRGLILQVGAFAEEMNKSRRMMALQSRKLAAADYVVLQLDLLGCGDSSGDFGDATWDAWLADVTLACQWLKDYYDAPLWLWGHRTGCLLTNEVAGQLDYPVNQLFWQPVISGKLFLQQFLRLKVASEMIGNEAKGSMERLRKDLQDGVPVEIAGYRLSSPMARGLDRAELRPPSANGGRVEWLEISSRTDGSLSPATNACLKQWRDAGRQINACAVPGAAFWQTTEIVDCPALRHATLAALSGEGRA